MPLFTYRACVSTTSKTHPIYDADTVRLAADVGFGVRLELGPCRLFGIDAPEMRGADKVAGKVARDWLREKLASPENEWFTLQTIKDDEKGKYGRYLAIITLDDGTVINDELVSLGHAVFRTY